MKSEDFSGKLILAPMAGYTDLPFRLLAREYGADITISEMISAKGLYYGDTKTAALYETVPEEKPYGIQLFGSEPEILAKAAGILKLKNEDPDDPLFYDFIDFNAGCPAPKVVKNGDGSALIREPKLLAACITALVASAGVPVTVKSRKGFVRGEDHAVELARIAEDSGAAAFTLHGRTRDEYYQGHSDWNSVAEAASAVDIPVILSGDIRTREDAMRAEGLGASSLMIGRAAVGDPMLFHRIKTGETGGVSEDRIKAALRHIALTEYFNNSKYAIIEMRKHLAAYTKGLPDSAALRKKIFEVSTPEEARELFRKSL